MANYAAFDNSQVVQTITDAILYLQNADNDTWEFEVQGNVTFTPITKGRSVANPQQRLGANAHFTTKGRKEGTLTFTCLNRAIAGGNPDDNEQPSLIEMLTFTGAASTWGSTSNLGDKTNTIVIQGQIRNGSANPSTRQTFYFYKCAILDENAFKATIGVNAEDSVIEFPVTYLDFDNQPDAAAVIQGP